MNILPQTSDRGAALLTVLMIVAVMSVAAVAAVASLSQSVDLTRNASHRAQLRLAIHSVSEFGAPVVEQVVAQTVNGQLPDDVIPLPFDRGHINLTATDATNCFNLNQIGAVDDGLAEEHYQKLLVTLGFFEADARTLSDSLADWIDSDDNPRAYGQESNFYARQDTPYMAANTQLANISELHGIEHYTPEIITRLLPFVCVWPTAKQTPLNIETLSENQASLLVALFSSELSVETAESLVLARPLDGWTSPEAFLSHPSVQQIAESARNDAIITVRPNTINLHAQVSSGPMTETLTLTYDIASGTEPVLLQRVVGDTH